MQNFFFSQREFRVNPRLCFVIMPIDPALKNVYDTISTLVEDYAGMNCVRADEIAKPAQIINDIWTNINEARFLIADLTGHNPNVFYEIGMAHALNKAVVLLTQSDEGDVPFDLRQIRHFKYDLLNLKTINSSLPEFLKSCISTIPSWNTNNKSTNIDNPYCIKLTSLDAPPRVYLGHQFDMTLQAQNIGKDTKQGYFSISFPQGIDDLGIVSSNAETKIGLRGDKWKSEKIVLKYPIAEAFTYGNTTTWSSQQTKYLRIQAKANRKGLLWFYISSSTYDDEERLISDPIKPLLDVDQREEYVYCGVIEVI